MTDQRSGTKGILQRLKDHAGLILFVVAIIIMAVPFHYPVRIVNALTAEPVPGFDIHISAWRVLFEPFTGPLLFYLRAHQPLKEFTILLIWVILLILIVRIIRSIRIIRIKRSIKVPRSRSGFFTSLTTIVLTVSIWLGLLWLIIYLPLPSNTMINQREDTILINTHSHTEYSHDGIISTRGLQKWHKRNGYDAFFITDHNHHQHTLETVRAQENGDFPGTPLIMCGEEFSGSNHMTLLGLTSNFSTGGLTDQQVIDTTHNDGGVVIVAHWFDDERKSIPYFTGMGVDGFEIANQASGLTYNRRIFRDIVHNCTTHGLLMTGAADYHGYGSTCFTWNALEIPGWHQLDPGDKREAIMKLLRQREMSKFRVLLYNDRELPDPAMLPLSPLYTAVSYFRTLNTWQLLSWVAWLVLICLILRRTGRTKQDISSLPALETLSLASSLFLIINGIILFLKARNLTAYNDIYSGYSTLLLASGAGFMACTSFFIWFRRRKKKRTNTLRET